MALVNDLLPELREIRAIPGELGLHPFKVTRITRTWSSGTIGHPPSSDSEEVLFEGGGQYPHCRQTSPSEVDHYLGAGPLYVEGDWLLGPITPQCPGGGYAASSFDSSGAVEIFYRIEGNGLLAGNNVFQAVQKSTDKPFGFVFLLRRAPMTP